MNGTRYRWPVLWAAFVTYLFDSYDLMVLAIAMPVLLKVLNITLPEGGLLGSATMLGAMAGSVLFGLIAENYGRRFALLLALVWLGIGMGVVYFMDSWTHWMVLRFMTGIAIGGIWGPCAALIAEHWSPEYRGRAASFVFSSFAIGAVLASLVGRLVLHVEWQWLFVAGTVSIPAALLVIRLVPPDPERSVSADGKNGKSRIGIGAIFEGGLARTTFLATLVSIVNLAGYWGAAFWIPTFLTQERGLSLTTMAGFSFVMYLGMFLGFQFFGMLSDWIGRRRAMIAAFVTVAAAVAVYIVVRHPTVPVLVGDCGRFRPLRFRRRAWGVLCGALPGAGPRLCRRLLLEYGSRRGCAGAFHHRLYRQGPRPADGSCRHLCDLYPWSRDAFIAARDL